jgi:TolB-like protein/Flp pilus assembly protein TadD
MPGKPSHPLNFWQELKRRKVLRVITVYAAVAFVILQLVEILAPSLRLPDWTMNFILVVLIVGFIIAIILSWIYDIHPEGGIVKTEPAHEMIEKVPEKPSTVNAWKIATIISIVVIICLVIYNILGDNGRSRDIQKLGKTIAVLPFENMSDGSEFEHLGDAMTDEIIMQLYKISEFEVRSRTSIMKYKNTEKASPVIAGELNVNFLLEGTVQRYEDKVRIRVQLIHALTDDHLWGEIYNGDWKDIFDIQINVAKQVAEQLQTALSPGDETRIENRPTDNIEAYNLYLQGRNFFALGGAENHAKSIECYKRALEIDPNYALAYAGMATTLSIYGWVDYVPDKDVIPQAKKAAMKALELDNTLGEARAELAHIKHYYEWDWAGAENQIKRALELNPNYARAHEWYGYLLTDLGRFDEALLEFKRGFELDPLATNIWVGIARLYYFSRDYDSAIAECRKVLKLYSDNDYALYVLALALSKKGLHDEAIELRPNWESPTRLDGYYGYVYGAAGREEKALELLNGLLEYSKKEYIPPNSFAYIYIGLGKKDKAFEWLEKGYEQRAGLNRIKVEPMYDSLRSDPRFQDLVDRMSFPD